MRTSINSAALSTYLVPQSPVADSYRTLMTKIKYMPEEISKQCIMVTSVQHKVGTTTTASNLAISFAQDGDRVLLIDMAWRSPLLHQIYSMQNHNGCTDIWKKKLNWRDVVFKTNIDNLSLITAGNNTDKTTRFFSSKSVNQLIEETKQEYEVIIIDSPPIITSSDAKVLAAITDGVLLVVKERKTKKQDLLTALKELEYVNGRLLGTVIKNKR